MSSAAAPPLLLFVAACSALLRGAAGLSTAEAVSGRARAARADGLSVPMGGAEEKEEEQKPTGQRKAIGMFVQVANVSVWSDLASCISNVVKGARIQGYVVDLHVGPTPQNTHLVQEYAPRIPGVRETIVQEVQNKGADIGEFFQQIQQSYEHKTGWGYDLVLKIHSKSSRADWRYRMLSSLCGSVAQVQKNLNMFKQKPNLGIIGPYKLIWTYDTPEDDVSWGLGEYGFKIGNYSEKMKKTWDLIYPGEDSFPARDRWLISGGCMYWVRPEPLFSDKFQAAIPKFLNMWEDGYIPECETEACVHMYALERVIPTMYYGKYGLDYAQAERFPEDNLRLPWPTSGW